MVFLLLITAGIAYYYFVYRPSHLVHEEAYVLPASAEVVDSTSEIRLDVETVRAGERLGVLSRSRDWAHVRLADGQTGWIEAKNLLDASTYESGQTILKEMESFPPQAAGHTVTDVNLHLDPSREAPTLALLNEKEKVEVYGRRLVDRALPAAGGAHADLESAAEGEASPAGTPVRDAWYFVGAGKRGGWVLGRFVALDIPPELSGYAEDVNVVAWVVLDRLDDNGRKVPQYLVADRIGTEDVDFNHIRVFTWWVKRQQYVTSFVEGNLTGYFPIQVTRLANIPYFRLRLVDAKGRRIQEVFQLDDTIVRRFGTVEGWTNQAMPTQAPRRSRRRR